ncbi:MAG: DUF6273 domain-containing protein [Bacilli bacterium]|nr:DUF6273 domain-containing protein [Bacilli bacterium]
MKKRLFYSLIIVLLLLLSGCSETPSDADVEDEEITTPEEVIYYFDAGYHNPIIDGETVTYSKMFYGEYPQTLVIDEAVISALNLGIDGETIIADSYGYYPYEGNRYASVSTFTREIIEGNQVLVETREFYLVDSIEWRILSIDGTSAILLADKVLDSKSSYNDSLVAVGETKSIYLGATNMNLIDSAWSSSNEAVALVSRNIDTIQATVGIDNNWWIAGKNTYVAVGEATTAILEIDENGYWVINDVTSALKAQVQIMVNAVSKGEVVITGTGPTKENPDETITVTYKIVVVDNNDKTWGNSYLRHWLNNDFYNAAFSSSEKEAITLTSVSNQGVSYAAYHTNEGLDTQDYVYLLSYNDLLRRRYGFNSKAEVADPQRSAFNTEFAIKTGVDNSSTNQGKYFSRSPGFTMEYLSGVFFDGKVSTSGFNNAYSNIGIRPVITIQFAQ